MAAELIEFQLIYRMAKNYNSSPDFVCFWRLIWMLGYQSTSTKQQLHGTQFDWQFHLHCSIWLEWQIRFGNKKKFNVQIMLLIPTSTEVNIWCTKNYRICHLYDFFLRKSTCHSSFVSIRFFVLSFIIVFCCCCGVVLYIDLPNNYLDSTNTLYCSLLHWNKILDGVCAEHN